MNQAATQLDESAWYREDGSLDCVKMKRALQKRVAEKLANLHGQERVDWLRQQAEAYTHNRKSKDNR